MKNSSRISEKEEKLKGGVESSVSLGAAISFYQAVLGPVAESVTIFGAMSSVGIPIAAVGIAITAILSSMASSEQKNLSKKDAQKFLEDELTKKSNEIIYQLLDVSRILNNQHVADEIMLQEERLINSLPDGLQDLDLTIECLENLGTVLWNREIELQELLDFYNAHPIEKIKEIVYIDPVEYEIDCFTKRLNALKTPAYIDTSCRAVFMPILFLSEENKEHIFSILHELCAKTQTFISKISKSRFEHSYYYEDKICAIYFSQMTGQKKIQLEYIDVFARDEQNVLNFRGKIREGSILTDCQMRRKILCDISRAKEKVEILVPWMNNSINDSFSYYKNYSFKSSMCQAIEQALENGATVVVGCGNSENSNKDLEVRSKETKEKLEEKLKKYCEQKKLIFHMRSFTHEKFLIVDDRIALCGSYNFLSNKGQFIDRVNTPLSKSSIFDMHQGRRSSDEREFPGESMKLTENIESIRIIRSRMEQKYN